MENKKLLFAASASIGADAIKHYLSPFFEKMESHSIALLDGNSSLKKTIMQHQANASVVAAKSRSEIRNLLQETAHLTMLWDGEDLTKLLFEARLLSVPAKIIPVQVTRIVNKKVTNEYDVYIGRGSIWGNPFAISHGDGPDRDEVIKQYREYFFEKLETDPDFKRGILGLRGYRLACFCKPQACHGDIIAAYLDNYSDSDNTEQE